MLRAEASIYSCQRVVCFFQGTDRTQGERLHILPVSKEVVISGDNEGHHSVLLSVMGCNRAVRALWLGGDTRMGDVRAAVGKGSPFSYGCAWVTDGITMNCHIKYPELRQNKRCPALGGYCNHLLQGFQCPGQQIPHICFSLGSARGNSV